jgi:hypothetical protein
VNNENLTFCAANTWATRGLRDAGPVSATNRLALYNTNRVWLSRVYLVALLDSVMCEPGARSAQAFTVNTRDPGFKTIVLPRKLKKLHIRIPSQPLHLICTNSQYIQYLQAGLFFFLYRLCFRCNSEAFPARRTLACPIAPLYSRVTKNTHCLRSDI